MARRIIILLLCLFAIVASATIVTQIITGNQEISGVTQYSTSTNNSILAFGAIGDGVTNLTYNVTSNSTTVTSSGASFTSADVGKIMELYGVGPVTSGTNHQDLIAVVSAYVNSTNVTLDRVASSTTNCSGIYGTQNANAFQAAANAANGSTNFVVYVPAGTYLLVSPEATNASFSMGNVDETHPAFNINYGGIHFIGVGQGQTILHGGGAWKIDASGQYPYRGCIVFAGPMTNDAPISFEHMTIDGGNRTYGNAYTSYPASLTNGSGWDVTQKAMLTYAATFPGNITFNDCEITRWGGEALQIGTSGGADGNLLATNCFFHQLNATALGSLTYSWKATGCTFTNLAEVFEFYEGYCSNACYFTSNTCGGFGAICAINGALAGRVQPPLTMAGNTFNFGNNNNNGIQTCAAQNLNIWTNTFSGNNAGFAIVLGVAGQQGNGVNSNISILGNTASNVYVFLDIQGNGANSTYGATVFGNTGSAAGFAGGYGWSTNVLCYSNSFPSAGGVDSQQLTGQYIYDDPSDSFLRYNNFTGYSITYQWGYSQEWTGSQTPLYLDDYDAAQTPPNAVINLLNNTGATITNYLSVVLQNTNVVLAAGASTNFYWHYSNSLWNTN